MEEWVEEKRKITSLHDIQVEVGHTVKDVGQSQSKDTKYMKTITTYSKLKTCWGRLLWSREKRRNEFCFN